MALPASSVKQTSREAGSDAPRVASRGQQAPRVLFTSPECRAIVLNLECGETMGDHRVRERSVVQIVSGLVSIESSGETIECGAGVLVTFEPGETHSVHALEDARLLLLLAPWPATDHVTDGTNRQHLPANATLGPIAVATDSIERF